MLVVFEESSAPSSLGELQRAIADALVSVQAGWDVEHDHLGRHTKPMSALDVAGSVTVNGAIESSGSRLWNQDTGVYSVTLTATTHDLKKNDGRFITEEILRLDASATRILTGIAVEDTEKYQRKYLVNGSNNVITLAHNTGSSAKYRFSCPNDVSFNLGPGRLAIALFDADSGIIRILGGGGGLTQRGTITIAAAAMGGSFALPVAVDLSTAQLRHLGTSSTGAPGPSVRLSLVSATQVDATRSNTSADVTVSFEVTG